MDTQSDTPPPTTTLRLNPAAYRVGFRAVRAGLHRGFFHGYCWTCDRSFSSDDPGARHCHECRAADEQHANTCPACEGAGLVPTADSYRDRDTGEWVGEASCAICDGWGRIATPLTEADLLEVQP